MSLYKSFVYIWCECEWGHRPWRAIPFRGVKVMFHALVVLDLSGNWDGQWLATVSIVTSQKLTGPANDSEKNRVWWGEDNVCLTLHIKYFQNWQQKPTNTMFIIQKMKLLLKSSCASNTETDFLMRLFLTCISTQIKTHLMNSRHCGVACWYLTEVGEPLQGGECGGVLAGIHRPAEANRELI